MCSLKRRPISASAKLTETGLSVKTRSRLASAIDRLGGNLVDALNAPLERRAALVRAKTEAETTIIEALGKHAVAHLAVDSALAQRALTQLFGDILKAQANKDAVISGAVEQLRLSPPKADSEEASEELSEEFLGRFDDYARSASTEDLRMKWSSVLAAEVRKPGTVSNKVMRIVDEVPPETAKFFHSFCVNRLDNVIFKHLSGEINFGNRLYLTQAELLTDPGIAGHRRKPMPIADSSGNKLWFFGFSTHGISLQHLDPNASFSTSDPNLTIEEFLPHLGVYVLTDAGQSVASIFEHEPRQTAVRLANTLEKLHPGYSARVLKVNSAGHYEAL